MSKSEFIKEHLLGKEEEEILEAFEQGELKSVDDLEKEMVFAKQAATNYFRRDTRINIRLSHNDLNLIKQKAAYEGLPYQTLIASLLHKYAVGHV